MIAQRRLISLRRRARLRPVGTAGPTLTTLSYIVVLVASAIAVGPLFYLVSTSFKDTISLFSYPPDWIPSELYWGNYRSLLFEHPFLRWILNTLLVASVVTAAKVFIDSMAGYAFAKLEFPGKGPLFVLILATLMIPFAAILIPLFLIVRGLGMLNSYWALILPPLANPLGIFLMRSFIQSLPKDLENSARLDGCSEFGIYWRIILPLVKPGLVVLAIVTFLAQYISFLWPLVVANDEDHRLLTTGIATLKATPFVIDWGIISAGGFLAVLPILIVFLALQRYFIAGSLAGALKQ